MGDHAAPQAVGANAKWNALQPADIENFSEFSDSTWRVASTR
jgi:hypothetical protein